MTTNHEYPALSDRAIRVCANASTKYAEYTQKEKNKRTESWIYLTVMLAAIAVDVGIGVTFNVALVPNLREALTTTDQVTRGFAAFAMVATLMAIVAGLYATVNTRLTLTQRIAAFVATMAITAGVVIVASAIGYHTRLGTLIASLWNGASSTGILSIEALVRPAAAAADPPFAVRLATSTWFLGVGLLAAIAEVAWLKSLSDLARIREMKEQYVDINRHYRSYEMNRDLFWENAQALERNKDVATWRARAIKAACERISVYKNTLEAMRPQTVDPATVDKAVYERNIADNKRIDDYIKRADEMAADSNKIFTLVESFFQQAGLARGGVQPQGN